MENKVIAKEYVEKNFVEKDKIRKIIKNIEKEMDKDEVDDFGIHSLQWLAMDWIVDYLKRELLEDK